MIVVEHRASIILYNLLKSMNNDKVFLVPANICPIVLCTFLKAQRKFELIDISDKTLCIDEDLVLKRIQDFPDKYGGIIFVRTYGVLGSFEDFFKRLKKYNQEMLIIDNRCLSIPEFSLAEPTNADVVLFSTGYSKFVDVGWGGFAFLNNGNVNYARNNFSYDEDDLNMLTKGLKKAIAANTKYEYSDTPWLGDTGVKIEFSVYKELIESKLWQAKIVKQKLNDIYNTMLPKEIQLKKEYQMWRFNIMVENKQQLLDGIFKRGLFASSHYAPMNNIFQYGFSDNARNLHDKVINLFNDYRFDEKKAEEVCRIINKHINDNGR